jgi:hypothetical protein
LFSLDETTLSDHTGYKSEKVNHFRQKSEKSEKFCYCLYKLRFEGLKLW